MKGKALPLQVVDPFHPPLLHLTLPIDLHPIDDHILDRMLLNVLGHPDPSLNIDIQRPVRILLLHDSVPFPPSSPFKLSPSTSSKVLYFKTSSFPSNTSAFCPRIEVKVRSNWSQVKASTTIASLRWPHLSLLGIIHGKASPDAALAIPLIEDLGFEHRPFGFGGSVVGLGLGSEIKFRLGVANALKRMKGFGQWQRFLQGREMVNDDGE